MASDLALDAPAIVEQLGDVASYHEKIAHLRAHPEAESEDVLELGDGRVFQRYSRPQVSGGSIVGRVWNFRDITEQRKMQAGLVVADRLASMGTIAAGVAHEINNPLAYVTANLAVLAEELPKFGTVAATASLDEVMEILKEPAFSISHVVSPPAATAVMRCTEGTSAAWCASSQPNRDKRPTSSFA